MVVNRRRIETLRHHGFRLAALALDHQLVESAEIGVGGGDKRVWAVGERK